MQDEYSRRSGPVRALREAWRFPIAFMAANPVLTAAAVTVSVMGLLVFDNAVEQTKQHPAPLFATRTVQDWQAPRTIASRSIGPSKAPATQGGQGNAASPFPGDPEMARIQSVLTKLNLYDGAIDGVGGPQTRDAISRYQEILQLPVTGRIDKALRISLGGEEAATSEQAAEMPPPEPISPPDFAVAPQTTDTVATGSVSPDPVRSLQRALVNFGFHELVVDGQLGAQTRDALKTFQRIEELPETGDADEATLAALRMRGFMIER